METKQEHRGMEQMAARRDNRPEVAGSTPAPATTPIAVPIAIEEPEWKSWPSRRPDWWTCECQRVVQAGDLVTAMIQVEPGGKIFRLQFTAGELLQPAQQLETIPGMPQLLRMSRIVLAEKEARKAEKVAEKVAGKAAKK